MFDFPSPATEGQFYAPPGGPQYVYTSGAWRTAGAPTAIVTAQERNRIVNGAFQIAQEQTSTTANGGHFADQWLAAFTGAGTITCSQITTSTFRNMGRLVIGTIDASIAAGDYLYMMQNIEGSRIADFMWGTVNAIPAVLRFTAIATSAAAAGTYYVSLRSGTGDVSFVAPFVLSNNVWTDFTIPIPACTTGTWPSDTSKAMMLTFAFAAGTGFHAPSTNVWVSGGFTAAAGISNGWGTAANDFRIAKVGLYLDPQNTGVAPAWQMPDEAEELRACQRYWEKFLTGWNGYGGAGLFNSHQGVFAVTKRIVPACSATNSAGTNVSATTSLFNQDTHAVKVGRSTTVLGGANFDETITANARM